jgi:hypothetical protein
MKKVVSSFLTVAAIIGMLNFSFYEADQFENAGEENTEELPFQH